ncbi:hypothetical protein U9M48_033242 [Paspalum notatum var. saurae]|uniref:Legume lectin domain-containing protein n=1 Tax=Paspalum notatum var. saurae TaxID=547442 RepID=A0AAQ3U6F9_PASNO
MASRARGASTAASRPRSAARPRLGPRPLVPSAPEFPLPRRHHRGPAHPRARCLRLTPPPGSHAPPARPPTPSDTPPPGFAFQWDAFYNKAIRLTRDERLGPITSSAGHAFYSRAVPLADPVSRRPACFATAFAFSIAAPDPASASGAGLAFFLSPFPSTLPDASAGGLLGLFNSSSPRAGPVVAVEFDTYKNEWDPSADHVGVDLGGIVSAATVDCGTGMKDGRTAHARVAYDAAAGNLTVALSYGAAAARPNATDGILLLWYAIDLWDYLPDSVAIGFSAAMGEAAELH